MIAAVIRWSVGNRFLVLLATLFVPGLGGRLGGAHTPVDALPDLSDVQVIIRTSYPGPGAADRREPGHLSAGHHHALGARRETVRGYSFFGDSFVYVLFEDGTDLYWARSRVLEYLNQVQSRLPATARAGAGADATGVGWIYQYALIDRTRPHDLRSCGAAGLVPAYELKTPAQRRRGRHRRRHGQAVPGRARSGKAGRLRHHPRAGASRRSLRANRKPAVGAGAGRGRVHGAQQAAICRRSMIFARCCCAWMAAFRSRSAMSPTSSSARRCAAASPSWTARARRSAAW
jgi:hypothetical protein